MPGLAIGKISELFELVHASLLSSAEWKTLERGCLSSQVWRGGGKFHAMWKSHHEKAG